MPRIFVAMVDIQSGTELGDYDEQALDLGAPVIGLAGGIGSGKSAVAHCLAELGCTVSNADEVVKRLLGQSDVRDVLVQWWGTGILDAHGNVDRRSVARIAFADDRQRARLEAFLHPLVDERQVQQFTRAAEKGNVQAFVIDAPLLFEAGLDRRCRAVIFVDAPRSARLRRVGETRGWDEAELDRREKSQWPLDTKRQRSDHVIVNSGDLVTLGPRVEAVFNRILRDYQMQAKAERGRES